MKILITAPSLDEKQNVSGISTVVRQIIKGSREIFYHFQAGRRDDEKSNLGWFLKQTLLPVRFFQTIRREKIDVAHINTALNPLSIVRDFALVKAARGAGRPVLLHIHGGRFLAENFQSNRLAHLAEKMLRSSDAIVVLSELEKNIVENRWKNLTVRVLENAVALDKAQKPERNSNEKTIIFLGRFHESKGLSEIVKACRTLREENFDFCLTAYGAGELKDFFVGEMTKTLGDKFYYGGVIADAEKWRALARADVFLLPSRYGEGLPMAMLEAMAAGCTVVVSEMASTGAAVKNGVNGFLIEPRNVSQLTQRLKSILSNQIDLETIGRNARETVEKKFDLSGYIKKLERIYKEIKR